MDGPFFSLLPQGKINNHLLYHVKHSVIKESKKLTEPFHNLIKKIIKIILKKLKN